MSLPTNRITAGESCNNAAYFSVKIFTSLFVQGKFYKIKSFYNICNNLHITANTSKRKKKKNRIFSRNYNL